jgi:hypothetical protein
MRLSRYVMAVAAAASMAAATGAVAASPTRSAVALSSFQKAPVTGLRTATPLKHKSSQADGDSPALGYILAAVVGAGIVTATIVATDDDSDASPVSPG